MKDFSMMVRDDKLISNYNSSINLHPEKRINIENINKLLLKYVYSDNKSISISKKMRNLKSEFAEWLIKNPRVDYFNNNKKKIESILDEYNTFFDVDIFKCSLENYKEIQNLILQKLLRVKQIEDNAGHTLVSEGIDANYQDMINYAVFALIHLNDS